MKPIRIKPNEFKLENFVNYYIDNAKELLCEYPNSISRVCLIDKDYMDVIYFDEDYDSLDDADDYINLLLSEEYALHFVVGKTYENAEKIEFLDGSKYTMKHFLDDLYEEENNIKSIGDLSLDLDHLVGLLFDFDDNELVISVVNFEHNSGVSAPRIYEAEDSGDLEPVIQNLLERFTI